MVPPPLRLVCEGGSLCVLPRCAWCAGEDGPWVYFSPSIAFFAPGCYGTGSVWPAFSSVMPLAATFTATSASLLSLMKAPSNRGNTAA